jgi:hypothetical protein
MSINSPRFPGHYPQSVVDCEHAIDREFFREVVNAGTPYIDLDRILAGIAGEATAAGWAEQELTDAVLELARRHALDIRQTHIVE